MSNKFTVRGDPILFVLGGNRPDGRFLLIDSVILLLAVSLSRLASLETGWAAATKQLARFGQLVWRNHSKLQCVRSVRVLNRRLGYFGSGI